MRRGCSGIDSATSSVERAFGTESGARRRPGRLRSAAWLAAALGAGQAAGCRRERGCMRLLRAASRAGRSLCPPSRTFSTWLAIHVSPPLRDTRRAVRAALLVRRGAAGQPPRMFMCCRAQRRWLRAAPSPAPAKPRHAPCWLRPRAAGCSSPASRRALNARSGCSRPRPSSRCARWQRRRGGCWHACRSWASRRPAGAGRGPHPAFCSSGNRGHGPVVTPSCSHAPCCARFAAGRPRTALSTPRSFCGPRSGPTTPLTRVGRRGGTPPPAARRRSRTRGALLPAPASPPLPIATSCAKQRGLPHAPPADCEEHMKWVFDRALARAAEFGIQVRQCLRGSSAAAGCSPAALGAHAQPAMQPGPAQILHLLASQTVCSGRLASLPHGAQRPLMWPCLHAQHTQCAVGAARRRPVSLASRRAARLRCGPAGCDVPAYARRGQKHHSRHRLHKRDW